MSTARSTSRFSTTPIPTPDEEYEYTGSTPSASSSSPYSTVSYSTASYSSSPITDETDEYSSLDINSMKDESSSSFEKSPYPTSQMGSETIQTPYGTYKSSPSSSIPTDEFYSSMPIKTNTRVTSRRDGGSVRRPTSTMSPRRIAAKTLAESPGTAAAAVIIASSPKRTNSSEALEVLFPTNSSAMLTSNDGVDVVISPSSSAIRSDKPKSVYVEDAPSAKEIAEEVTHNIRDKSLIDQENIPLEKEVSDFIDSLSINAPTEYSTDQSRLSSYTNSRRMSRMSAPGPIFEKIEQIGLTPTAVITLDDKSTYVRAIGSISPKGVSKYEFNGPTAKKIGKPIELLISLSDEHCDVHRSASRVHSTRMSEKSLIETLDASVKPELEQRVNILTAMPPNMIGLADVSSKNLSVMHRNKGVEYLVLEIDDESEHAYSTVSSTIPVFPICDLFMDPANAAKQILLSHELVESSMKKVLQSEVKHLGDGLAAACEIMNASVSASEHKMRELLKELSELAPKTNEKIEHTLVQLANYEHRYDLMRSRSGGRLPNSEESKFGRLEGNIVKYNEIHNDVNRLVDFTLNNAGQTISRFVASVDQIKESFNQGVKSLEMLVSVLRISEKISDSDLTRVNCVSK